MERNSNSLYNNIPSATKFFPAHSTERTRKSAVKNDDDRWQEQSVEADFSPPRKDGEKAKKWCLAVWNEMKLLNYNKNE
jgi:hypothetical protein